MSAAFDWWDEPRLVDTSRQLVRDSAALARVIALCDATDERFGRGARLSTTEIRAAIVGSSL